MAKRGAALQGAAEETLAGMTQAQKILQQAKKDAAPTQAAPAAAEDAKKKRKDNGAPFTFWASPEEVQRWKTYARCKKHVYGTQNELFARCINEFIQRNPVTAEEKADLLKALDI